MASAKRRHPAAVRHHTPGAGSSKERLCRRPVLMTCVRTTPCPLGAVQGSPPTAWRPAPSVVHIDEVCREPQESGAASGSKTFSHSTRQRRGAQSTHAHAPRLSPGLLCFVQSSARVPSPAPVVAVPLVAVPLVALPTDNADALAPNVPSLLQPGCRHRRRALKLFRLRCDNCRCSRQKRCSRPGTPKCTRLAPASQPSAKPHR